MPAPAPYTLDFPPGFLKVDSPNAARGRFIDGDHVRFINNKAQKWKGWNKLLQTQLLGTARGAVAWTTSFLNTDWSVGTHLKLYILQGDDTITDITPVRRVANPLGNNPFTTALSSNVVTVADTTHGAIVNDFVTYSGAVAFNNVTIVGTYQVQSVIDANTYTILAGTNANANGAGGGNAVVATYQINTGLSDGTLGLGYGAGTYGSSTYGTQRATGIQLELRTWSMDIRASNLLCSPSGGSLYQFRDGTDTVAVAITNAPASIRAMFVTAEGYVFALGTSTPMTVQWPDQIDITQWTAASNNTANSRVLAGGSKLMGGLRVADGVSLVWSDTNCFLFQFTGDNLVYASRAVGDAMGLMAPLARAQHNGIAYWMTPQGYFQMYLGYAQNIPNQEDIRAFVYSDMDLSRFQKTWARYDANNNQLRWHYCSLSSTTGEPDKYVDVTLDGNFTWTTGTLDRTTGSAYRPAENIDLLVSSAGYIYAHDEGTDADGSALQAFITYAPLELTDGADNMDVTGIIPDFERQTGAVTFEFTGTDRPDNSTPLDSAIITVSPGDPIDDMRLQGRLAGLTIRSNVLGGDFRVGKPQLELGPAGQRR